MSNKKIFKSPFFYFIIIFILSQIYFLFNRLVQWDESVYIGIGKFLFSLGQVGLFERIRPLFLPLLLGGVWKAGLNPIFYGRIISLLFSSANLFVFYLICRKYFNKTISILSTILLAVVPFYFIYSTKIFSGIIASFFILLAYYYFTDKKYYLTSLFLGFATITRFSAGIFFIMFIIYLSFQKKFFLQDKKSFYLVLNSSLIFLIPIMPYFIINLIMGNGLIEPIMSAASHQNNYNYTKSLYYYFDGLLMQSLLFIFSIPGIYYTIKKKQYAMLFCFSIPFLYFMSIANKQIRFFNLFLPFIVLISVFGYTIFFRKSKKIIFYAIFIILIMTSVIGWQVFSQEFAMGEVNDIFYFEKENNSIILTSNPIFSAYTDNKFIPYYFDVYQGTEIYEENINSSDYVIYSDEFPCEAYQNTKKCEKYKDDLEKSIENKDLIEKTSFFKIFE